MKLAGISGKARGKMGSMVFATAGGEQIVRQYQPNVANPSTTAQVQQRAKMKLMTQLAAAVCGEIVIPKQGLKSSRNLFVKKNFGLTSINGNAAQVDVKNLQFTAGNVALPPINANVTDSMLSVDLENDVDLDRVVYLCYKVTGQRTLQFAHSEIVNKGDSGPTFDAAFDAPDGDLVVYAYGMKDNSASASAKYGNYNVTTGTALASLIAARSLSPSDYTFTATSGKLVLAS